MKSNFSYFKQSAIFTAAAVALCYFIAGIQGAFFALILGVLETSLSFDNAVVNATVLKDMDPKWRGRFLTWGMIVAVFGMRIVFPVLIVWATSPLSLMQSILLPFENAHKYAETITAAHINIAGFGGTFLMMIFLKFFLDENKDAHWIPAVEKLMVKAGKIEAVQVILTLAALSIFGLFLPDAERMAFVAASVWGLVAYLVVDGLGSLIGEPGAVKAGIAGFLYLELVDASFSFDGVIGAFAVTNNIILIALGLGIGAMFVRSLTMLMVDKDTLAEFQYLEHGAFYSIGVLSACMYLGTIIEIPEVVTGLSAAVILGIAVVHSMFSKQPEEATA